MGALLSFGGAECAPPGELDSGNASIRVDLDGSVTEYNHDPLLSVVSLTPPAEGTVALSFSFQDPPMALSMQVDTGVFSQEETIEFPLVSPLSSDELFLSLDIPEGTYDSADDAEGSVVFDLLDVDDELATALIGFSLDVTLRDSAGGGVGVEGFVEGSVQ